MVVTMPLNWKSLKFLDMIILKTLWNSLIWDHFSDYIEIFIVYNLSVVKTNCYRDKSLVYILVPICQNPQFLLKL